MTLLYWESHLIPRWVLRSMFILRALVNGLVSWGSPGKYSMIDCFLGDTLGVFSCQFWSTVGCLGWQYTPKLLDLVVSGASSVVLLCLLLHKIGCNPMHPLYGALPVPYAPVQVTCGAVIMHHYTYAPPHCRTPQFCRTSIPLSVSLWNVFTDLVFDDQCFHEQIQCLFIGLVAHSLLISCCVPFLVFHSMGWYCGAGIFGLIGC